MGNYCCANTTDSKLTEIEESKRERFKIAADPIDDDKISIKSFILSSTTQQVPSVKHLAKRYLCQKFFSLCKQQRSFDIPGRLLPAPLQTPIEIQIIEERTSIFPSPPYPDSESLQKFPAIELESGEIYEGFWNTNTKTPDYFGLMLHPDHSKYIGSFVQGKKSGPGRLMKIDGEVYEGEFKNDLPEGFGVLNKSNGLIYKGHLKKGKEHGQGVIEYEGEEIYSGGFLYGSKHGVGKLKISEGNRYEGEFVNNCMEGQGKYVWDDGKVYEGSWKMNKLHGEGKYVWPDGREYEGSYNDGNRDGFGIFKWPDGREYRGEWYQGNMHGIGTYTFKDKSGQTHIVKAHWENGKKKKLIQG